MTALTPIERSALLLTAVLTALAGAANYNNWPAVPRFALATLALAGLAWVVSFATEQLGERFGPGVTGMLQSTLGNLPELFVVIFALQKGELVVAQTAIVGSILANALLVLGLVIVVGARRSQDGIMRFSKRLPRDTATLLQVTVFIIVLLGLSLASHDPASHHVQAISAVGAVCLLVVYLAWVVPYLRSDVASGVEGQPEKGAGDPSESGTPDVGTGSPVTVKLVSAEEQGERESFGEEGSGEERNTADGGEESDPGVGSHTADGGEESDPGVGSHTADGGEEPDPGVGSPAEGGGERTAAAVSARADGGPANVERGAADDGPRPGPRLDLGLTFTLLVLAGTASAFVSDWFINGLQPAISILHISQAFAGLVIVAIAGNAAENTAGIVLAYKRRSDLAISVVKNSVAQIAAFLFPLLVLVSLLLATTLTFALAPVYIGALALTALALWQVTGDGEAAEFEGWALVALYVILATLTLYE